MRVAIVGAGVCGLTAAYRLGKDGHTCDVYERWPGLGGQAATFDLGGGHLLERYYHHLFTSDRDIAALYDELGLPDELEWRPSSVAFFLEGRLWPFTTPVHLLRFRPLSPLARLRMGLAVLLLQRRGDVTPYERVTARQWIERSMGQEPWRKVWGPLLRGKFGSRADDISMAWLWSKLTLRRRLGGDEARQEMLGYPRSSWETLFERLRDEIHAAGGSVLIDRPVARLARTQNGRFALSLGAPGSFRSGHDPRAFQVEAEDEEYDAVVATVSCRTFIELLDEPLTIAMGEEYLERLRKVEYHAALCLVLVLDREFTPFYWTNIADTSLPFVGLIEQTNFVEAERYGGRRVLYVANYLEAGHELLELDEDELIEHYTPGLRKVNPAFSPDWIKERWLFREPDAQPIVTTGYAERIPPVQSPVPGLLLANTAQVYPEDRGTNYAVRLGHRAEAELVAAAPSIPNPSVA